MPDQHDVSTSDETALSVDTGVEVYEREPVDKHLPMPDETTAADGKSKKQTKQKELVIDKTTQLVESEKSPQHKKRSSASFSGGFKGLFRRKAGSSEEAQREKEERAQRKQREKEEKERLKREKKNAKKASLKKRAPSGSDKRDDDAKSDVTSEHTTPRTPRAADVTTSVSASSQGLNESRDEEKSSTPVTSSPRSDAVNERAVDVGDESFPEEERSFPVEVRLRHDGSLVTLTHDYYSLIFIV